LSSKISDKDKKDWENFLSNKDKLISKDQENKIKSPNKIRTIDLHGQSLDEANNKIKDFILKSFDEGTEKLKIITGKGIHSQNEKNPFVSKKLGILKYSVPDFLHKDTELTNIIKSLSPAAIEDGGEGAFYIYLCKKNDD
jgi:DNA-nicking Smr family endonuclease